MSELPGKWRDVSDESKFKWHWHRGEGYPSIRIMEAGRLKNAVEIYPDPRDGKEDVWRTTHDSHVEAMARVYELMEEYPE